MARNDGKAKAHRQNEKKVETRRLETKWTNPHDWSEMVIATIAGSIHHSLDQASRMEVRLEICGDADAFPNRINGCNGPPTRGGEGKVSHCSIVIIFY